VEVTPHLKGESGNKEYRSDLCFGPLQQSASEHVAVASEHRKAFKVGLSRALEHESFGQNDRTHDVECQAREDEVVRMHHFVRTTARLVC